MKAILIFLVYIIVLVGCGRPTSPNDHYEFRFDTPVDRYYAKLYTYTGKVIVKMESGSPCVDAFIFVPGDLYTTKANEWYHADSTGTIYFKYYYPVKDTNQTAPDHCETSIAVYAGHDSTFSPKYFLPIVELGDEWTGKYEPLLVVFDENIENCFDIYRAILTVHFESGAPCITAWAHFQIQVNANVWSGGEADSTGTIILSYSIDCDKNNPLTLLFPCYVFINDLILPDPSTLEYAIWGGDIEMIKIDSTNSDYWPEPIEIIIPDSLNQ